MFYKVLVEQIMNGIGTLVDKEVPSTKENNVLPQTFGFRLVIHTLTDFKDC